MHILEQKIREAAKTGRQALIPYVTAGFPTREAFWPIIAELDAHGADIIEIGVPFSDPVADGPVVEAASNKALLQGITLGEILAGLRARKGSLSAGLVLMGYMNPFLQYGLEKLAADAADAGVHGIIVPDLPIDEAAPLRSALGNKGIALVSLVGPNTSLERMKEYNEVSQGYVYVVSVLGTTGERKGLPPEVPATLRRARETFAVPVALGFGLREPAQLESFPPDARPDAVVFGSALLRHLEAGNSAASFLAGWK